MMVLMTGIMFVSPSADFHFLNPISEFSTANLPKDEQFQLACWCLLLPYRVIHQIRQRGKVKPACSLGLLLLCSFSTYLCTSNLPLHPPAADVALKVRSTDVFKGGPRINNHIPDDSKCVCQWWSWWMFVAVFFLKGSSSSVGRRIEFKSPD